MNGRLDEIRKGVNTQITSSVTLINSYASQIAELNDQIGKLSGRRQPEPAERPAGQARPAGHGPEQAGQGHRHARR
jgi:hypothetical protein